MCHDLCYPAWSISIHFIYWYILFSVWTYALSIPVVWFILYFIFKKWSSEFVRWSPVLARISESCAWLQWSSHSLSFTAVHTEITLSTSAWNLFHHKLIFLAGWIGGLVFSEHVPIYCPVSNGISQSYMQIYFRHSCTSPMRCFSIHRLTLRGLWV